MCGQSHDYVCKAHPLYARKTLTFRVFAGRPVIQSSSKLNGCASQPIENQTGQAPFWKNWCAKSVSGVGLCEASALRPEQIGKLWFLGNSSSLCLATIGHQLLVQRRFSNWELANVPKISRHVSVLAGVTRHACECKPYTVPFWSILTALQTSSVWFMLKTATNRNEGTTKSSRFISTLFVLLGNSLITNCDALTRSSVLCGSVIWNIIFRLV